MADDKKIYPEFKQLNLPQIGKDILDFWEKEKIFNKSISSREGMPDYVFYEGPPSANGMPGIHHVMARAIKDIFCRYHTLKGEKVERKGGWDTHGLPIELSVEKTLGIRKDDIGKKISVEDYNKACRTEVMKYKEKWDEVTRIMGYWVDLKHPYITYENSYIESVWWLLKELYKKDFLYKGYTIQPYSPAAGTGLSSHELNQPGTYKPLKDTTVIAQFKISRELRVESLEKKNVDGDVYFLAWTTTPWTLPSNTALAVGEKITYSVVKTFNQYTYKPITVILAKDLVGKYFPEKNVELKLEDYREGDKNIPFKVLAEMPGKELLGIRYEQLLPYVQPSEGDSFKVVAGDFVTTEDGTGIVHIAPSFGADDFRTAKQNGLGSLTLVDKQGKFISEVTDFANEYVKEQYLTDAEKDAEKKKQGTEKYLSVDERISIKLKKANRAFKVEKFEHNYPHCWRTDKPILYYPLDSWFVRTTAAKERMIELNNTINWKPEATGTGRFGNWLENLVDWNLSRSRFWGIPLPIWRSDDGTETLCIGSVEELYQEIEKSIAAGFMKSNPVPKDNIKHQQEFDLHKPYIDNVILVSPSGKRMTRESDLIDVWFDSGSMPYAQWHYPFESPLAPEGGRTPHTAYGEDETKNTVEESAAKWMTANPMIYTLLKENAKSNRDHPTRAEEILWTQLSGKKLSGFKFRRQHIIGDYIVDFVCLSKKLVVEVDGGYHSVEEQIQLDEARTNYLGTLGFKVIRFLNDEVIVDIDAVVQKIFVELAQTPTVPPGLAANAPFGGLGAVFPADFIAEGVDQTRGWFFTLHAIATMVFDSVAFKNVVSNGLVLDKAGNKMSKRLGNAVDPFSTIEKYGPDAVRWYLVTNASPWDNLKFDIEGVAEKQRSFFGTLYNTYAFFALYANIDGFVPDEKNKIPFEKKTELDRWILSSLNSLIEEVSRSYDDYDPTPAGRAIEKFVDEQLSNWYVRLSRRRFWRGEMSEDKQAAYETLYECLHTVSQLMSPVAPFFADWLYRNLTSKNSAAESVHLTFLVKAKQEMIDKELEEKMDLAQKITSMILAIRKKENLRVRQPLQRIQIPVLDDSFRKKLENVKDIILSEVNVKELEFVDEKTTSITKNLKLNFKTLGKKYGKLMKAIQQFAGEKSKAIIEGVERDGKFETNIDGEAVTLLSEDVEIIPVDLPGWKVMNDGALTVALDITVSAKLKEEGLAREFVNRIQNLRKDKGFEVTDKISLQVLNHEEIKNSLLNNKDYICAEILATSFEIVETMQSPEAVTVEVDEDISTRVTINKN